MRLFGSSFELNSVPVFPDVLAAVRQLERDAAHARAVGRAMNTLVALIVEHPRGVAAKLAKRAQARRVYQRERAAEIVQFLDIEDRVDVLRVIAVERQEQQQRCLVATHDFYAFAAGARRVHGS